MGYPFMIHKHHAISYSNIRPKGFKTACYSWEDRRGLSAPGLDYIRQEIHNLTATLQLFLKLSQDDIDAGQMPGQPLKTMYIRSDLNTPIAVISGLDKIPHMILGYTGHDRVWGHMGMHDIGHGYFPAQFRLFLEICEVEEMAVAGMVDGILYRLKILWSVVPAEMVLRTDFHAPA